MATYTKIDGHSGIRQLVHDQQAQKYGENRKNRSFTSLLIVVMFIAFMVAIAISTALIG